MILNVFLVFPLFAAEYANFGIVAEFEEGNQESLNFDVNLKITPKSFEDERILRKEICMSIEIFKQRMDEDRLSFVDEKKVCREYETEELVYTLKDVASLNQTDVEYKFRTYTSRAGMRPVYSNLVALDDESIKNILEERDSNNQVEFKIEEGVLKIDREREYPHYLGTYDYTFSIPDYMNEEIHSVVSHEIIEGFVSKFIRANELPFNEDLQGTFVTRAGQKVYVEQNPIQIPFFSGLAQLAGGSGAIGYRVNLKNGPKDYFRNVRGEVVFRVIYKDKTYSIHKFTLEKTLSPQDIQRIEDQFNRDN